MLESGNGLTLEPVGSKFGNKNGRVAPPGSALTCDKGAPSFLPRVLAFIVKDYGTENSYLRELLLKTNQESNGSIRWRPTGAYLNHGELDKANDGFEKGSYNAYASPWKIYNFVKTKKIGLISRRYIYSLIECDYK